MTSLPNCASFSSYGKHKTLPSQVQPYTNVNAANLSNPKDNNLMEGARKLEKITHTMRVSFPEWNPLKYEAARTLINLQAKTFAFDNMRKKAEL